LVTVFALAGVATPMRAASAQPAPAATQQAEELYKRTDFEASLALLDKSTKDAATEFLIGRDYFMLGDFKKSVEFLQKAATSDARNSEYVDWLGRAYGKRAETGNPLAAPGNASKARQAFELAVSLNPRNSDALSDLFDYYLEAPGFLGGGADRASALIEKISVVDPPEAFFEQAKLEQRRRDFDTAERHLLKAIEATPQKISGFLEYAKFLAAQGRNRESDEVLLKVQQMHPEAARVWYTRADILIRQHRDLPQAKSLLQRYLQASLTVDDPPKQDAARLLRQAGGA
jgi:tetratricopeptide (TPR) repeat protein